MKLTGFQGIKPRTSPRLVGDTVAQIASNTVLSSGEARPLCQPALTYVPLKTGPLLSIYKADALWFSWPYDVDVCRSPLPGTVRWIYSGDGEPRITTADLADTGFADNYPAAARPLGLPKPQTAPTVVPTGGALTDVDRFYQYSFYDDWNQESAFSPLSARITGKPDATQWAVTGMDATPPNSGDITALTFVGDQITLTTTNPHFNRAGDRITLAGVTTVHIPDPDGGWNANALNGTWTLTAVNTTAKTMTFTASATPEAAVTNLFSYSEEFDNVYWGKSNLLAFGAGSVVNAALAPDGTTTMDKIVEAIGGGTAVTHGISKSIAFVSGTTYTLSTHVKAAERTRCRITVGAAGFSDATGRTATFNLATGAVTTLVGSGMTAAIEPLPGGIYRVSMTFTTTLSASVAAAVQMGTATTFSYIGDDVSGMYLWGHMLEVTSPSALPSRYVKSVAAATTRTGLYDNAVDTADTWTRESSFGACTKRLYRTTGSTGQFQLVAEGISGTSYNDSLSDQNIPGDEAISADWDMPPADLKGAFLLPSGAVCGFSGNEVCFSEPFQPHAWPSRYRMRAEYPVVAAGLFTSGVVAATTGTPLVIIGHEPGQMAAQPATGAYPCLSKRSMVSLGDSVGYATAHGYARIGDNGVDILTKDTHTRDDWDNLAPATMLAATVRGRLYLMTQGEGAKLLIFDYLDGTGLTTSDVDATALYADAISGKLYISDSVNQDVREFDPNDGVYLDQDWMSKEFVLPEPANLGAARINFAGRVSAAQYAALLAAYTAALAANAALITSGRTVSGFALGAGDVGGELGGDELGVYAVGESAISEVVAPSLEVPGVTFTLYVNGTALFSKTVTDTKGFTLPSGYKHDTFAVRVQGQSLVKSIDLAQTLQGLKGA